jgi:hypothetical protein
VSGEAGFELAAQVLDVGIDGAIGDRAVVIVQVIEQLFRENTWPAAAKVLSSRSSSGVRLSGSPRTLAWWRVSSMTSGELPCGAVPLVLNAVRRHCA